MSPANRGGLLTAMILLYVLMGTFSGYFSARFFKFFGGEDWKNNMITVQPFLPLSLSLPRFHFLNLILSLLFFIFFLFSLSLQITDCFLIVCLLYVVMGDSSWMTPLIRRVADLDPQRVISERVHDGKTEEEVDINYQSVKVVGNGSFGVVFQIRFVDTGGDAAIKRVLQDKRFKVSPSAPFIFTLTSPESRIANHEANLPSKRRRSQILLLLWR